MKGRLTIMGIIFLIVIGLWLWMWIRLERMIDESQTPQASAKVEEDMVIPALGRVTFDRPKEEEDETLTWEEFNELLDEYLGEEEIYGEVGTEEKPMGLVGFSEMSEETKEEKKDEDEQKLIQQIRYEQLARLLPRYLELAQEYHDLQKMWDYIQSLPPCEEVVMYHKREREICEEWGRVMEELARLFPEAVVYKPYEGPDSPGYFGIDYRKLRELVGGRLPVEPYFRP